MELTIGVSVGSSIQIAAGMIPLLVIIAWPLQKDLTLFFVSHSLRNPLNLKLISTRPTSRRLSCLCQWCWSTYYCKMVGLIYYINLASECLMHNLWLQVAAITWRVLCVSPVLFCSTGNCKGLLLCSDVLVPSDCLELPCLIASYKIRHDSIWNTNQWREQYLQ